MSYRVTFGGTAQVQYHTLPKEGREALIERAVDLTERPWDSNAVPLPPGFPRTEHYPRIRQTVFGSGGRGILTFYVDEDDETILIYEIVWMD